MTDTNVFAVGVISVSIADAIYRGPAHGLMTFGLVCIVLAMLSALASR